MLPVKAMRLAIGELIAADVAFLAPVAANKVALIIAPFTFSEDLVVGDLTLATFTGSTPKGGVAGTQQAGIDPATGDQIITNLAPVGGWRWECTATPVTPEVVWGYALLDTTLADLVAVGQQSPPVSISEAGQFIDLGALAFRIVRQPVS